MTRFNVYFSKNALSKDVSNGISGVPALVQVYGYYTIPSLSLLFFQSTVKVNGTCGTNQKALAQWSELVAQGCITRIYLNLSLSVMVKRGAREAHCHPGRASGINHLWKSLWSLRWIKFVKTKKSCYFIYNFNQVSVCTTNPSNQ